MVADLIIGEGYDTFTTGKKGFDLKKRDYEATPKVSSYSVDPNTRQPVGQPKAIAVEKHHFRIYPQYPNTRFPTVYFFIEAGTMLYALKALIAFFLLVASCVGQEKYEVTNSDGSKTMVYTSEGTKLSPLDLAQIRESNDRDVILNKLKSLRRASIGTMDKARALVNLVLSDDRIVDSVGILDYQEKELRLWKRDVDDYFEKATSLKDRNAAFEKDKRQALEELLLPDQLRDYLSMRPISVFAIPKSLVLSGLGEHLELTDLQRSRIQADCEKQAVKLHEALNDAKRAAIRSLSSNLSKAQLEELENILDKELSAKESIRFETLKALLSFKNEN